MANETDITTEQLQAELTQRMKAEEEARLKLFKEQYDLLVKTTGVAIEAYAHLTPDGRIAVTQRMRYVLPNQPT